jgi:hypothetical protein
MAKASTSLVLLEPYLAITANKKFIDVYVIVQEYLNYIGPLANIVCEYAVAPVMGNHIMDLPMQDQNNFWDICEPVVSNDQLYIFDKTTKILRVFCNKHKTLLHEQNMHCFDNITKIAVSSKSNLLFVLTENHKHIMAFDISTGDVCYDYSNFKTGMVIGTIFDVSRIGSIYIYTVAYNSIKYFADKLILPTEIHEYNANNKVNKVLPNDYRYKDANGDMMRSVIVHKQIDCITVYENMLFVVDNASHAVSIFDINANNYINRWFLKIVAQCIAVHNDYVYIMEYSTADFSDIPAFPMEDDFKFNTLVHVFDIDGNYVGEWSTYGLSSHITFCNDKAFVLNQLDSDKKKFYISTFG